MASYDASKRIRVKMDKVADVMKGISLLAETRVMAGVPGDKTDRNDEGPINNATLMYIHENGAPEINLPARPVVHPAVESIKEEVTHALEYAAVKGMQGEPKVVEQSLNAVGILAQNAMRKKITDGPFAPLSPRTIAGRAAKAGRGRRKGEQKYLDLVKGGLSPAEAQSAVGIKPLIDTGQLRRSLTYVIRKITWNGKMTANLIARNSKKK